MFSKLVHGNIYPFEDVVRTHTHGCQYHQKDEQWILQCQIPTGIVDFACVKDKMMKIQNIASSFITRKTATQVPDSVGSSLCLGLFRCSMVYQTHPSATVQSSSLGHLWRKHPWNRGWVLTNEGVWQRVPWSRVGSYGQLQEWQNWCCVDLASIGKRFEHNQTVKLRSWSKLVDGEQSNQCQGDCTFLRPINLINVSLEACCQNLRDLPRSRFLLLRRGAAMSAVLHFVIFLA